MAGLALCGVGLWLLLSPAQYRATAVITVEQDEVGINRIGGSAGAYDPYYIPTTFEVIQSQIVLSNVVSTLNLNVEWGKKYAGGVTLTTNESIAILKKHLNLGLVRNTKLVEISYTSEDPNEAARIANTIAKAYQDYRLEKRNQETRRGIEVLQQLYLDEEKKIQIQQTNVDLLREKLKIQDDASPMSHEPSPTLTSTSLSDFGGSTNALAEQPYWEAKRKFENMIDFHKLLQAKIAAEKLDLAVPKTMVPIVSVAQPPKSPAGPNRFLGAVLLAIGLFPTVGGFLMLKSSRQRPFPAS